jgi:hypothetical protein
MTGSVGDSSSKPIQGPGNVPPIGPSGPTNKPAASQGETLDDLKKALIQKAKDEGSKDPVKDGTDLYNHLINMMGVDMINELNDTKAKPPPDDDN